MNHRLLTLLLALTLVPLTTACNLGPGGDDDDAADDDDDGPGLTDWTITELNTGNPIPSSSVRVTGAMITTPFVTDDDEEDTEAMFWVQDGSGPNSGIRVFTYRDIIEQIEGAMGPGDILTIEGTYEVPFGTFDEIRVDSADQLQVTGTGSLPEPYLVDASEIQSGFGDNSLEGIILAVEGVTVDEAPGWDNYFEWQADGVIIKDQFVDTDVNEDYLVDSIAGVFAESFGNKAIHPRWDGDVNFTHPGCTGNASDSVVQINCGEVSKDEDVSITIVVTSPAPWYGDAFYGEALGGGDYSGINIYAIPDISVPPIGTTVSVSGEYEEYRGQSEVVVFSEDDIILAADVLIEVLPTILDSACDITEAHEGRLVQVASVEVGQSNDGASFGFYEVYDCPNILVDSAFFESPKDFQAASGGPGLITGLTGIVVDEFDSYGINPRGNSDWTDWTIQ